MRKISRPDKLSADRRRSLHRLERDDLLRVLGAGDADAVEVPRPAECVSTKDASHDPRGSL